MRNKTKTVTAVVTEATYQAIEAAAKKQDRKRSYIINGVLQAWAIKQGIPSIGSSSVVAKPETKPKAQRLDGDYGANFGRFWNGGMRKVNKKAAQKSFLKLFSRHQCDESFPRMLIQDIQKRLALGQLGFAEMHPTTYLNGERWNDDYPPQSQQTDGFANLGNEREIEGEIV